MDKIEIQVLIKRCFLIGKNTVEAKQWLDKYYKKSAPGKSTIIDWYAENNRGRTNTDDAERSGHPKSAAVPENIRKVHKIVLGDRKLKLRKIADTLKISEGSCFRSGCRVRSHPTKNNNASKNQSAVWSCSSEKKRTFCIGM